MNNFNKQVMGGGLVLAIVLLTGCGSSSSDSTSDQSTVSGSVFASYINGANISVYDTSDNLLAGPVTSNSAGQFTLNIEHSDFNNTLVFKSSGGQFTDEASGALTDAGELSTLLAPSTLSASGTQGVHLTPGTSIIEQLVNQHGKTLSQANQLFENAFGYQPAPHIAPVDAGSSEDASVEQKLAGLRAAAFSQLVQDLGSEASRQFELLNQLAEDIADGDFDGMRNATDTLSVNNIALGHDIQNKFLSAFLGFKNSDKNKTALKDNEIGILPFAKIASSNSYEVEYVPGMMAAMQGKTTFKIKVRDFDGNPISGLAPMLMPVMHMANHQHSTPKGSFTETSEAGTYQCTLYYLMSSMMASGQSMGYWDLEITVNQESVHFYPLVMMPMTNTARAVLKGQDDKVPDMNTGTMIPRPYYLFNNGLTANGDNHDFSVFIASRENMMSFPTVTDSTTLNAGAGHELAINSIAVEMSTNQIDWTDAVNAAPGIWTVSDLSGLNSGAEGMIYVRLVINGEQKTDDGSAPDGTADEAIFFITPNAGMNT